MTFFEKAEALKKQFNTTQEEAINIANKCEIEKATKRIQAELDLYQKYGYKKDIFVYFLIRDWEDVNKRLDALRKYKWFKPHGQPYRNFNDKHQVIPQWQKDMAHWMNKHNIYFSCEFKDFEPRKGFKCKEYFK